MQAQKTALQVELADLPEAEKLIELHPAALSHYAKLVTALPVVFHGGVTADTEEAAEKVRSLIARIVIFPTDNGLNIELLGRLTMILGPTDLYPNMRIAASGGTVVARARYHRSPDRMNLYSHCNTKRRDISVTVERVNERPENAIHPVLSLAHPPFALSLRFRYRLTLGKNCKHSKISSPNKLQMNGLIDFPATSD